MVRRPNVRPNPAMVSLWNRARQKAHQAAKEQAALEAVDMPLTDDMRAKIEEAYAFATHPRCCKLIDEGVLRLTVFEAATTVKLALGALNLKSYNKALDDLYERVRAHYAPFHVEFVNIENERSFVIDVVFEGK